MRLAALLCIAIGLLGALMAALTAVEAAPAFVAKMADFGVTATTTGFWAGLAVILLLTAIAFGVSAEKE